MTQAPTAQSKRKRPPSNSSESASRVRVVRLIRLANILLKGGRPVSRKELQEGLEVARATLTRDLTVLRDQLNMPIVYDAMEDGYYLARDSGLAAGAIPCNALSLPGAAGRSTPIRNRNERLSASRLTQLGRWQSIRNRRDISSGRIRTGKTARAAQSQWSKAKLP